MISWIVAAAILVFDQVQRNRRSDGSLDALDDLTAETRERLKHLAEDARDATFEAFLTPKLWFPRKWSWTVYLYDIETELLTPIWPAPKTDQARKLVSFSSGKGATGQAWEEEVTVVRTGSEVHDATHGLTDAQQEHFKNKNSVVATPIWSDKQKIGVLAGIAEDVDESFEAQADRSQLMRTATILATLLSTLKTDD